MRIALFLVLGGLAFGIGAQPVQKTPDATVVAAAAPVKSTVGLVPESCSSRASVPAAELSTLKKGEYSLYVGFWPKVNICQMLLVKAKDPSEKISVVYAYEGSGQYPAGSIRQQATFSGKSISFALPWQGRPQVTYDLSSGEATYQDPTGIYPGHIVLKDGSGLIPFESS